jgi:formylglycine-generating enzyme required for sulfatase activity
MGGEDEIIKACAGSTGSNTIDDYARYSGNSASTTHPVGDKLANELNLFDISGNVWEWCWDYSGGLPTGEVTDYRGPGSDTQRVYRGSSWNRAAAICALDVCRLNGSYNQTNELGFRVVRQ